MNSGKCVLCKQKKLKKIFFLKNSPRYTQKLLHKDNLNTNKKINVSLYKCDNCDMVQTDPRVFLQGDYFEDYLMSRSCTELCTKYDTALAREFVSRFNLESKLIIDIGCGDGYFAEKVSKENATVEAIEPSKIACKLAQKKRIKCYNVYLNKSIDKSINKKYDGFVSKQVVDLTKDPNAFLKNLKKILKPKAFGLIEVPSWTKTVFDRRYYDILPDRVSYFTVMTLTKILERNNFHVLEARHDAGNEYILAFVCYEGLKNNQLLDEFKKEFAGFKKDFRRLIKKLKTEQKTVFAWGAGAKGASMLSFAGMSPSEIRFVLDKDTHKQGAYLPGSLLKIVSPDILNTDKPDAIIITAAMFCKEIVTELVNNYNYKGQIIILTPSPHILSEKEKFEILKRGACNS